MELHTFLLWHKHIDNIQLGHLIILQIAACTVTSESKKLINLKTFVDHADNKNSL